LDIPGDDWHRTGVRKPLMAALLGLVLGLSGCKSRQVEGKLEQAKALTAKKPEAALKELDRALAEGADEAMVTKAKAAAYQRLNQLDEAEKLLRSVLAKEPNDHEALVQLAHVAIARGNLDDARKQLALAIVHEPPHVPTLLLYATLAKTPEDGARGLAAFDLLVGNAYASFRKSAEYVAARASLLAARGDGQTAVNAWLREKEKSKAFDPKLSLVMADGFAKLDKGPLALWLLARASSSPSAAMNIHEALAEKALAVGDVRLAKVALSRLGGNLSRSPNMLLLEARLLELQDQGLEATKLTRRALDLVPKEREKQKTAYALAHARALAKERLLDDARRVLEEVLKSEPSNAQAKLMRAAVELEAGRPAEVNALVADLLGDERYAGQAQTLIVRALLDQKNGPGAKRAAQQFFAAEPSGLHGRLLLAQTLVELGEEAAALELLDSAPPAVARELALARMRVLLSEQVAPARTEAMVSEYLRVGVASAELKQALGRALLRQKRLADAEGVFRDLAKDDPSALEEVARLEREQGHLPAAISTLQGLVALNPSSHSGWLVLGLMQREAGNTAGAVEAYEQALRLQPNDPVALNNLALLVLEGAQAKPRAVSLARRALAAMPGNPALEDTLGWALFETGDEKQLAEALTLLERARRALGTAESSFHYGLALAQAGRKDDAKKQLQAALVPGAGPPPAWRARAEQALQSLL
jgi:tetratricopeptide (TPR) repeat protein